MAFYDPLVNALSPSKLKSLANERLSDLIDKEAIRARASLEELQQRYPSAGPRELSQRLIDSKKQVASMLGGVTGIFGAVTVPVDLIGMVYLQLVLLVEVGTVFKADFKNERGKKDVLDLFGYANGIGPVQRASPKVLGSLAAMVLTKTGLKAIGRAMPLVAAPISAYLNNQHIQRVGDSAIRHYDGWVHAHEKSKKASGS
ncbi:MAG: hypothetical protein Q8L14_26140 [Myxococcales bacterium]|nr:hypothetical protein [Myxococcales bacterium]